MKSFTKKIILFILPLLIGLVSVEFLLRKIPNDYSYKNEYLSKNAKDIEVLYFGSSHAYYGINPEYDNKNSFNASHISQSIDLDYQILNKYSNDFKKLNYIFIPIDYFSLFGRTSTGVESWRMKNYNLYYGLNTSININDYFEVFSFTPRKNLSRISSFYVHGNKAITCSELGFGTINRKKRDLISTGQKAATRHTKQDKKYYGETISIIHKIISYSVMNNIDVIFYTSPAYYTYVNNLDERQLAITTNTMDSICRSYNNCFYFNLLKDNRFIANDFDDADHLSNDGAKKLTLILNDEMDRIEYERTTTHIKVTN